ncbi:tetrameric acyl-CoA thioesterase [Halobacteriovorax marinus]|uniref:DUF4442 domain-containing protein n=1 Tax=Halobacteriovorax marinus TaxID=97084 RepID=UPI000BC30330|nr:DUF4442 domain-containing protein [Halobacteriovorax marinus]ATH08909.1 tetrameric acyl-CoA thioesterase [Halobacteriovorax marinus]
MLINFIEPRKILKLIKFWPPYLGAGVYVKSISEDFTEVETRMKQRFYNTNYVGSHFGGSLYSMCDPFLMFILLHHLKDEHIVWDKSASINYLRPAKGEVRAKFYVSLEEIESIKKACLNNFSYEPEYTVEIIDSENKVVASVNKVLYVRRKDAKRLFKKV